MRTVAELAQIKKEYSKFCDDVKSLDWTTEQKNEFIMTRQFEKLFASPEKVAKDQWLLERGIGEEVSPTIRVHKTGIILDDLRNSLLAYEESFSNMSGDTTASMDIAEEIVSTREKLTWWEQNSFQLLSSTHKYAVSTTERFIGKMVSHLPYTGHLWKSKIVHITTWEQREHHAQSVERAATLEELVKYLYKNMSYKLVRALIDEYKEI